MYAIEHKLPLAPFDVMGMHAKKPTIFCRCSASLC